MSPVPGSSLYMSDPNDRKIYKLRSMDQSEISRSRAQLIVNFDVVAGTGESCYPLQRGDHFKST